MTPEKTAPNGKNNIEKTAPNGKKAIEKTAQYVIIMKKGACLDV